MAELPIVHHSILVTIDDDLFDHLAQWKWHLNNKGYPHRVTTKRNKPRYNQNIYLHRLIYALKHGIIPDTMTVDHIDQNKLNCLSSNLQLLTATANSVKNRRFQLSKPKPWLSQPAPAPF